MTGSACRVDARTAATAGPASSALRRCPDVPAAGPTAHDVLAEQLICALTPSEPARVTAAILDRLRDGGLLWPCRAGTP